MKPLFLLSAVSGETALYAALASRLEQHMPVQTLAGPQRSAISFRTLQATAAWYVGHIRTLQPAGPYRLAGWSSGGMMAYEVATQLIGENEQVEYLALLDASLSEPSALQDYDAYPIPARLHLFIAEQTANQAQGSLGWSALFRPEQIETNIVPGDHDSMLQLPYVATLAETISQSLRVAAQRSSTPRPTSAALLTLQAGRAGSPPIFCVPGAGDSVTAFASLGEALGPRFTLHGFQAQGLIDGETPHSSVEAAASCYVEALLREHPSGPFHLLGHSFGGWIVFEIATRMRALGRSPASITMIDTDPPGQPSREYSRVEVLLELASLFELNAARPLNLRPASFESLSRDAQIKLLHQRLRQAGLLPAWSNLICAGSRGHLPSVCHEYQNVIPAASGVRATRGSFMGA